MHLRLRIHHWVIVWICVGLICGAVALVNILSRNLSPRQVDWVLVVGAMHWLIGGVVCYALDAVKVEVPGRQSAKTRTPDRLPLVEWHYASEFVLPGNRRSLLPPKY